MAIRRILVAIRDLQHAPLNELHKAAVIAHAAHASVELFHAIADSEVPAAAAGITPAAAARRKLLSARCTRRLQELAGHAALRGLPVRCRASWDYPAHEAIVRRVQAGKCDLVVAATRRHRLGARLLLTNTDWELIRHCPVPVLLVKSRRRYEQGTVLAAVDPFHSYAKPTDLDRRLVASAAQLAKLVQADLHLFHAFQPLPTAELLPAGPPVMIPLEAESAHEDAVTAEVQRLGRPAHVPARRCHVCAGGVAGELVATVRSVRAALVVMGAVSRSAVSRFFIGNTAERVLDRLPCDVLVVKPRGFKSRVLSVPTGTPRATWRAGSAPPEALPIYPG